MDHPLAGSGLEASATVLAIAFAYRAGKQDKRVESALARARLARDIGRELRQVIDKIDDALRGTSILIEMLDSIESIAGDRFDAHRADLSAARARMDQVREAWSYDVLRSDVRAGIVQSVSIQAAILGYEADDAMHHAQIAIAGHDWSASRTNALDKIATASERSRTLMALIESAVDCHEKAAIKGRVPRDPLRTQANRLRTRVTTKLLRSAASRK